jgi:hypothetical protein
MLAWIPFARLATPQLSAFGFRHSAFSLVLLLSAALPAQAQDSALVGLVRDYTGLYTRETFEQWTRLFGPAFTSANTNPSGGITTRNLREFLDAQRLGFARAREMREELHNVRIEQSGKLASVWADFTFHYDGTPSKGKLTLLCIADSTGWKVHSLIFAYDR